MAFISILMKTMFYLLVYLYLFYETQRGDNEFSKTSEIIHLILDIIYLHLSFLNRSIFHFNSSYYNSL